LAQVPVLVRLHALAFTETPLTVNVRMFPAVPLVELLPLNVKVLVVHAGNGWMVVWSVAALFPEVGSTVFAGGAIVAVLVMVPVAVVATGATTVNVAVPPFARATAALIFPEPLAGQLEPDEATQLQVADVIADGMVSTTVAPATADGPLFLVTIV
jgi:hypothetical protein